MNARSMDDSRAETIVRRVRRVEKTRVRAFVRSCVRARARDDD